ncbi:hypothetical protein EIP91_006472 [Steccherinum ochraceum]|uniref:Uncharacterized protein n=1 Tax=Steccherinum ochraceum TaxID=92696 RepID=A0A4R0RTG4_9APHY|nr:hypothetical protein EIP91_006472 [Steccherinum ochraceum]
MPPSSSSSEVFVLEPYSADASFSTSSSHIEVSDPAPGPRPSPSPSFAPNTPTDNSNSFPDTIIDWEHIWEAADQSCLDPSPSLDTARPIVVCADDSGVSLPSPYNNLLQAAGVGLGFSSATQDDVLQDFGQRVRNLWNTMNKRDGTSQTITTIREDLHAVSKHIEEWMITYATGSASLQPSHQDIEKYKNIARALEQENLDLCSRMSSLERDLRDAKAVSEAWKAEARNVQNMQEMAVSAFERCNVLETENAQLKQAMHAFAEGSTNSTVKELRHIIGELTRELAQYKKRERALQVKENQLRAKENASIIEDMRKQTEDLKRRRSQRSVLSTLQVKNVF